MNIAGVILSGGASSRMGFPKALFPVEGRSLLSRMVSAFHDAVISRVIVVVGAHTKEIMDAHPYLKVEWCENKDWERGMFSSVQAGLRMAKEAVILTPVDVVGMNASIIKDILAEGSKTNFLQNIIPQFGEVNGHPVLISCDTCAKIIALPQTSRLDEVIRHDPHTQYFQYAQSSILRNINC